MKTWLVLIVAGLLCSVSDLPAQPLWMRRIPHGAGCPDCAPLDDSSSVRLMAQAAPMKADSVTEAARE
ncbi:MAG TPA: hypothetical protein VLZ12_01520 [Verrucomicrobiae bacterium]|nr:hypothetical protein [Verrucomicrobiae bacterium]